MARSLLVGDYRPLSEIVLDKLRDAIHQGRLKPGQRLVQEKLASQMGVSRMPVREALQRLAKEGLVECLPHRGAVVRKPPVSELEETFATLAVLERAALEEAVSNITGAEIAALERIQASMRRRSAVRSGVNLAGLNRRFHCLLIRACRLPKLCDYIESLMGSYPQSTGAALCGHGAEALAEHDEILAALKARDRAALTAVAAAHLRKSAREVIGRLTADSRGSTLGWAVNQGAERQAGL